MSYTKSDKLKNLYFSWQNRTMPNIKSWKMSGDMPERMDWIDKCLIN